jgi:hypothetical protein
MGISQAFGAHQRALGALIAVIGSREITAGIEAARRNGKVATLTVGLSHDVSTVLGIGRHYRKAWTDAEGTHYGACPLGHKKLDTTALYTRVAINALGGAKRPESCPFPPIVRISERCCASVFAAELERLVHVPRFACGGN